MLWHIAVPNEEYDFEAYKNVGDIELETRLNVGDVFFWNIEGTSESVEVVSVQRHFNFIGGEHVEYNQATAYVKIRGN